jgi:hypothetical protein
MVRSGIVLSSLFLTILIFALGILLNYALDFFRIDTIADVIAQHELDTTAYVVEQEFTDLFGGNRCEIMGTRIAQLKEEIRKVGADLGSYSSFSFFKKKDYDYLKRKYFLLELRFLTLIEQLNKECNRPYITIIFFYEIDDDASERQGFILAETSKEYEQEVIVLSLDKDYADEPLVRLLAARYNVTRAPTLIIDNEKREGLVTGSELGAIIRTLLKRADPFGQAHDFRYVLQAAGRDVPSFATNLSALLDQDLTSLARADILLVLGRITQNDAVLCEALPWYDRAVQETADVEQQALLYETVASLDCGRNKRAFLKEAASRWKAVNNTARARLIENLALSKKINLKFDASEIEPQLDTINASAMVIGETTIALQKGDRVLTQADRVKRDWLGLQMQEGLFGNRVLTTFSERLWYDAAELRADIGWHEGGRMRELVQAGIEPVVAYGTLAARLRDRWFAADDQGIFRFEVPLDKVLYPTTRFLRDDLAVLMDTHGVNMLVEQAVRNKVDAVLSDCDHPGKVKAAKYLSDRGIPVACFPDKYAYLALGHQIDLVGSPPIRVIGDRITIGGQPVTISLDETIVVMNATDQPYALWYYQTPAQYFSAVRAAAPSLKLELVQITDFNQMHKVVQRAGQLRAKVIAARVFNSNDYETLKQWLQQSPEHRTILFHSASYPYGHLLLKEFPAQTSFDDPNPRFVP